jgi:hypothetical protein
LAYTQTVGLLAIRVAPSAIARHDGVTVAPRCGPVKQLPMTPPSRLPACAFFASWFFVYGLSCTARAQDSYEIQVYAYDTVAPRSTLVEIHSNFTADGSKTVQDGVLPSNHAEHETLEITQGINDWAELGFYLFSSIQPAGGWQWVVTSDRAFECPTPGIGRWA